MNSITKIASSNCEEQPPEDDSASPGKKLMNAADALIQLETSGSDGLGAVQVSKGTLGDLVMPGSQGLTGRLKILCSSDHDESLATVRALKIRPPSQNSSDIKKG